ncbi:putative transmembrane protein [Candidatus Burkholderia pumila]|uniref:Transmembrane protein n=1 Tax=Candidatus Burkholderia pumila TaxID=1090375 RepID=A0ABR5HN31_9BURK|nr:putative transmembrane protein [Candidatus Burkholderia pumila]
MTTERLPQQLSPGPLRRIISSAFAIFETRLELIGIELQEEKERLIGVLFLGLAAMMLALMALISLTVLIALFFWDTYRWQALGGITLLYALIAIGCGLRACSNLRDEPNMFDDTLAEFRKDRDIFRSQ